MTSTLIKAVVLAAFFYEAIMAGNFLEFMGGIGTTPPKVYGTSAEDVAQRKQMADAANYWNNTRPSQTGYLPSLTGPSATNTGGAVYPWNSPSQMTPPTYGGNGVANPVQTTTRGGLNPATDKRLEHFLASEGRSVADLLAGIGSYGPPQMTAAGAATQLAQGGAPKPGYAPWGALSRSLAYNNLNPDPVPPAQQGEPWGIYSRGLAFNKFTNPPASQPPVGANPGMGGAMIGNGQMASGIPPQLPPADGSSPLPVWAGDNPRQAGGQPLGINVRGGQQPNLSPSQRYSLANMLGQINAQKRQSNANGVAGGYNYVNGKKTGLAARTINGTVYAPRDPTAAYNLANAAGQINALNRQATATGQTGVYNYVNGQKTGTVNGQSSANAYEAAAARSRDPGTSGEGGNPSFW